MDIDKSQQPLPNIDHARVPVNYLLKKIDSFMDKLDSGISNSNAQQAVIELQKLKLNISCIHTEDTKWIIR